MTEQDRLKSELYHAILKAAIAMGPNLKTISWFGRNHKRKATMNCKQLQKKAA